MSISNSVGGNGTITVHSVCTKMSTVELND